MQIKNKLFIYLFITGFTLFCQDNKSISYNENLIIGSWNLYSETYDNKVRKFDPNFPVITFSKDKSFKRSYKNMESLGRWAWERKSKKEIDYKKVSIYIKNQPIMDIEFYNIITLTKDSLIVSKNIGSKISYIKYIRNEK